jgi:metal-sulfur cluster biosynthetic enzyme
MTAQPELQTIWGALREVRDPEINHGIVELGMVRQVEVEQGKVYVSVVPTSAHCPFAAEIVSRIERAVRALEGVEDVEVTWGCDD